MTLKTTCEEREEDKFGKHVDADADADADAGPGGQEAAKGFQMIFMMIWWSSYGNMKIIIWGSNDSDTMPGTILASILD